MNAALSAIVAALLAAFKVDPKKALLYVMAAIGVLTTALEALKAVATALAAQ